MIEWRLKVYLRNIKFELLNYNIKYDFKRRNIKAIQEVKFENLLSAFMNNELVI